jgi:hypothetical protein
MFLINLIAFVVVYFIMKKEITGWFKGTSFNPETK